MPRPCVKIRPVMTCQAHPPTTDTREGPFRGGESQSSSDRIPESQQQQGYWALPDLVRANTGHLKYGLGR